MRIGNHLQERCWPGGLASVTLLLLASCASIPCQAPSPMMDWKPAAAVAAAECDPRPAEGNPQPVIPAQRKNRPRLHVRYGFGSMQRNGLKRAMRELDRAGFGEDYKYFGWDHTGPGLFQGVWRELKQNNPKGHASHALRFRDLRLDLSLTRRWAVGILFSSLGSYSIGGGKEIPVGDGREGIQLSAGFSGRATFLTVSFIPFPVRSSESPTLQARAGIGFNRLLYTHYNKDNYEATSGKRYFPCLVAQADYMVVSTRHWSLHFDASYKCAFVSIPGAIYERSGYSWAKYQSFHWREAFPALSADMGGFGCGISLGFHL